VWCVLVRPTINLILKFLSLKNKKHKIVLIPNKKCPKTENLYNNIVILMREIYAVLIDSRL